MMQVEGRHGEDEAAARPALHQLGLRSSLCPYDSGDRPQATGHRPTFAGALWFGYSTSRRPGRVGGTVTAIGLRVRGALRAPRMPPTRPMTQSPRAAARPAGNRLRPSLPPITANGSTRWLATLPPDGYALTSSHHHPTTPPPPLHHPSTTPPTHHPSIPPTHPSIPPPTSMP
jgi:hypothetical protein